MGLIIDVYRTGRGDCTGGGVSAKHQELTVVNVDGPFDPNDDRPAVALIDGHRAGDKIVVRVINCADDGDEPEWQQFTPGGVGPMFGGNYAGSSDGRWCREVGFSGAVPIHDRYETVEQCASYD